MGLLGARRERGLRGLAVVVSGHRHEAMARDLDSMAAGFVNKNETDAINFRNTIEASLLLQEMWHQAGSQAESGFMASRMG